MPVTAGKHGPGASALARIAAENGEKALNRSAIAADTWKIAAANAGDLSHAEQRNSTIA
jgi:hypothetical protein